MDLGLKNKIALVTGASRGLGFATARLLAQEARVAINGRNAGLEKAAADHAKLAPRHWPWQGCGGPRLPAVDGKSRRAGWICCVCRRAHRQALLAFDDEVWQGGGAFF